MKINKFLSKASNNLFYRMFNDIFLFFTVFVMFFGLITVVYGVLFVLFKWMFFVNTLNLHFIVSAILSCLPVVLIFSFVETMFLIKMSKL